MNVPMGSFDGAEICEIVGLYILNQLINSNIGEDAHVNRGIRTVPEREDTT